MGIQTTCIGAYPKPDYINIGSWSESEAAATGAWRAFYGCGATFVFGDSFSCRKSVISAYRCRLVFSFSSIE